MRPGGFIAQTVKKNTMVSWMGYEWMANEDLTAGDAVYADFSTGRLLKCPESK